MLLPAIIAGNLPAQVPGIVPRNALAEEEVEGVSSRQAKLTAIDALPFERLGRNGPKIKEVVDRPSFYRRMPTRQIACDPEMFKFLVRRPEVMVNIWDAMGITKVSTRRVSPFAFVANDGVGTSCRCDLVYGDNNLHIYYGHGAYDGNLAPRKVTGRCVCILRSTPGKDANGRDIVSGTMDIFLKLDNLGADLLTRTLGPFVGKTADNNFVETAKFIAQISGVCEHSLAAAYGLATKLDKVEPMVRQEFVQLATEMSRNSGRQTGHDRLLLKTQEERLAEALATNLSDHTDREDREMQVTVLGSAETTGSDPQTTSSSIGRTGTGRSKRSDSARHSPNDTLFGLEKRPIDESNVMEIDDYETVFGSNDLRGGALRGGYQNSNAGSPPATNVAPRKNHLYMRR